MKLEDIRIPTGNGKEYGGGGRLGGRGSRWDGGLVGKGLGGRGTLGGNLSLGVDKE